MASATAGVAAGALVADSLTNSNGRIAADYSGGGGGGKKKASGGGRHVATPAGSARYHLPIGAPLGQGKSAQQQASYDTFMASDKKSDMTRNANNMSNADLTKSAEAVFSVKTDNARNQAAQDVLVHELSARGIDPHKYGYDGGPVVVSPNPKADPTVTAQNKVQKAADTAAKAQAAKVAKDAAAAAKTQATAQKAAATQQAAAAKQAAAQASQAAQAAQTAQINAARDAAAKSMLQGTNGNGDLHQILGNRRSPGTVAAGGLTAGIWSKLRHPRDAHGRFINVGDIVHGDGVSGKVEGTSRGGKVQVKEASGAVKEVDGKTLQKLGSGPGDAVKGLDHATKGLLDSTDKALGKHPASPAAPHAPAAPKAVDTPKAPKKAPTHTKSGFELEQGDHFHAYGADGSKKTLKVDGKASTNDGHTVTATDTATGKQHTIAVKHGSRVTMTHTENRAAAQKYAGKGGVGSGSHGDTARHAPVDAVSPPLLSNGDTVNAKTGGGDYGYERANVTGVEDREGGGWKVHAQTPDGRTSTHEYNPGEKIEVSNWSGDGAPSSAPEAAAPKAPVPPLDEAQLKQHIAAVESQVDAAVKAGLSTDAQFSLDGKGKVWAPERAKLHNEIVNDLYAKAANVPNEGRGVFSGGLGGAGKTTTLSNPQTGIDQSKFLTINPDDVKEIMAARGMIPDIPGEVPLSPMEKVSLIHEESSHIANLLAQLAYADKKNVIWDITMGSEGSVAKRIAEMKKNGYGQLDAVFVDIPVEGSVKRAMARYQRGMEAYRNGQGEGGRYVPPSVIRKNASKSFSSANRTNFEALRDQFDNWQVWDNSVDKRDPRLVYSKTSPDLPQLTAEAAKGLTDADKGATP